MLDDPLAGRGLRAPEPSRMLVATEDGVFLWPGTALVHRRGNGFFAADPRDVNSALACFFGPAALELPLQNILERAQDELRWGHIDAVQQMLDRLRLPPISPNGARLRRAIAERQEIAGPYLAVADRQDGTVWSERDIAFIAPLYDAVYPRALSLEKIFNPGTAWDPAKHPRWPGGEADGGRFAPADEGHGSPIVPVAGPKPPWNSPEKPPGEPPKVPDKPPISQAAKYLAVRTVTYWLMSAAEKVTPPVVQGVLAAAQAAEWLWPYVSSTFDAPKTLEELQQAANNPQVGYNVHHVVEQTAAENDGFPDSQIEDPSNKVLVPEVKHWQITAWFSRSNPKYGGLSPRDYLKGKDWDTRVAVGLDGLRDAGVLK